MLQNIKADIIYYLSDSDFEMEFNLCGCCRMRLLTDKAADRKSLINLLARAVSRSRVILACGPLFSETGLINVVSSAISIPTAELNNQFFGIKGDNKIDIIKGSTPLVTPDGVFGGCIIERGPQTLILLSDNRSVRKSIMTTLIHPYMEELSLLPAENPSQTAEAQPEEVVTEATFPEMSAPSEDNDTKEEVVLLPEDISAEDEPAQPEGDIPSAEQEDEEFTQVEETVEDEEIVSSADEESTVSLADFSLPEAEIPADLSLPEEAKTILSSEHNVSIELDDNLDIPSDSDLATLYEDEPCDDPQKIKSAKKLNTAIIILSAVLVLIMLFLFYTLVVLPLRSGMGYSQYIKQMFAVAIDLVGPTV